MLRVTILNSSMSSHLSQLFAGLYDLHASNEVELDFDATSSRVYPENLLFAEVTAGRQTRRICFDTRDGVIIDRPALEFADVYFKRSYADIELSQLSAGQRAKVLPLGMNYACSADSQLRSFTFAKQLVAYERTDAAHAAGPLRSMRRLLGHPVRWLKGQTIEIHAGSPLRYPDFEATADVETRNAVIFLTRLWCPSERPNPESNRRREMNETRIAIIRTLRDRLGDRFLGGVERSAYSEEECPDCIIDDETIKTSYVKLMKDHLVGVATTGLHGSVGWKLAEYVAASRCIVSEPIRPEGSRGFIEDKHYLAFTTVDGCVAACERLLEDPTLSREMRCANADYYQRELKPPVMMLNRLRAALALEPQ